MQIEIEARTATKTVSSFLFPDSIVPESVKYEKNVLKST